VIAAKTPGFVGADLANIVNEAALLAAREGKGAVEMRDFDEAIERVVAGLQKKTRIMSPKEKKTVAYHECGHALVAELVPGADPVSKISIIPRGVAALGYTQQLPTEDRYLMTRSELLGKSMCSWWKGCRGDDFRRCFDGRSERSPESHRDCPNDGDPIRHE
jgi:cell division protease FtsH